MTVYHPRTRYAFTLVELLVVIAIMTTLTALMLPRLRVVNKDRNIREAARVVGSKFAEASDRARLDGKAALTLVRNPNFIDADGVEFAGTQIYLSRAVPNYAGDDGTPAGTMNSSTQMVMSMPLEWDPANRPLNVVRENDSIRISRSNPVSTTVAYRIKKIVPNFATDILTLTLDVKDTQPDPPSSGNVYFVVERQPKILRSSITDLPEGYIIDLRLSGPVHAMEPSQAGLQKSTTTNLPPRRPIFYEKLKDVVRDNADNNSIMANLKRQHDRLDIFFDSTGGIESVRSYDGVWDTPDALLTAGVSERTDLSGALQLFISPSELPSGNSSPLYSDSNLWVTVNNTTGGVSIGYNNPPIAVTSGLLEDLIPAARSAASSGVSSAQ